MKDRALNTLNPLLEAEKNLFYAYTPTIIHQNALF